MQAKEFFYVLSNGVGIATFKPMNLSAGRTKLGTQQPWTSAEVLSPERVADLLDNPGCQLPTETVEVGNVTLYEKEPYGQRGIVRIVGAEAVRHPWYGSIVGVYRPTTCLLPGWDAVAENERLKAIESARRAEDNLAIYGPTL